MKKKFLIGCIFCLIALNLFGETNEIKSTEDVLDEVLTSVVPMKNLINGSVGLDGDYVLFGVWPQSKKTEDVIIDISNTENINGWLCYKGSDECFYVKADAKPYDDYKFNDGTVIEKGKEYYFKIEPIIWRVVNNDYQGGKLLIAENILCSGCPYTSSKDRTINDEKIYSNNYENSTIRAWLNGLNGTEYGVEDFTDNGFINNAFSVEGIEKINTVNIDNSVESTGYTGLELKKVEKYVCNDTKDKIFLLSEKEVTKSSYGFSAYKNSDRARRRKTTDYSRAMGAYSSKDSNCINNGWCWLRSPNSRHSNFARGVKYNGSADSIYSIDGNRIAGGVVPALSISF